MTIIQNRQDTAANWYNVNPILSVGEIGFETDTNKFKIGDGVTSWRDLAYPMPTKTSQLTNDSGFINLAQIPTKTSQLQNDSGFLTEHQDISGKADKATTLAGYGITNAYTKMEIDGKLSGAMKYKGTVQTPSDLPVNPEIGDTYNVNETGANYAWNGANWDKLSENIDLSDYAKLEDVPTMLSDLTNDMGFIDSSALNGYAKSNEIPTATSDLINDSGFVNSSVLSGYATKSDLNDKQDKITDLTDIRNGASAGATALQSGDNISELNNDSNFITNTNLTTILTDYVLSSDLSTTLADYATKQWVNNQGYITGITLSDVTNALGYTPYNSTNPNGYITSADLPTNYVTTDTAQNITAKKTFVGDKAINFKQATTADKLGFTLYNASNTELAAFEFRPNTIGSSALFNLNMAITGTNYVGFRYHGTNAVNIVAPKVATAGNYYIPINITNGTTTVTANNVGTVNISTLLPDVSNFVTNTSLATTLQDYATQIWVQNQNYLTSTDLTDYVTNSDLSTTLSDYATKNYVDTGLATKQATLVSGTNIKTINGNSLLGSGNITIESGGGGVSMTYDSTTETLIFA